MEGKRGSECLLKSVSNIDFNPNFPWYNKKPPDGGLVKWHQGLAGTQYIKFYIMVQIIWIEVNI